MTAGEPLWFPAGMANVLNEQKRQQVVALGRLGWPLRRIEEATGVRRETASAYLKAAGIKVRRPGWGRREADPNPASMRRPAVSSTQFVPILLLAALAGSDSDCAVRLGSSTRLPFAVVEGPLPGAGA